MNPIRLTLFDHFMCTKNGTVFGNGVKIQLSGINTDFIPISHQHHISTLYARRNGRELHHIIINNAITEVQHTNGWALRVYAHHTQREDPVTVLSVVHPHRGWWLRVSPGEAHWINSLSMFGPVIAVT